MVTKTRVVVWSTGGIGSILISAIRRRPDVELVGVWVHSADKVGKDAGELANGEPIGLATTGERGTVDRRVTERDLHVAMGTLEAGTCGAVRMQAIGVVDGREAIVIEHVTRMAHDVAPDWPQGIGDLSYRVAITGDPDIDCTLAVTFEDPAKAGVDGMTSGAGAMVATAMRVLNAVPYVVAAEPGLVSSLDLPLTVPKNAMVSAWR